MCVCYVRLDYTVIIFLLQDRNILLQAISISQCQDVQCCLARALDWPSVSCVVTHEAKEFQDEAWFMVLFNEFFTIHSMEEL